MRCVYCESECPFDAIFCPHCGRDLSKCRICKIKINEGILCQKCRLEHQICTLCGGINPKVDLICRHCRGILNLPSDFVLHPGEYEFSADREALNALRSMPAVNMVVDRISKKMGKPWIEAQFIGGGIKVSKTQFPRVFNIAVLAARLLGIPKMPEIYITGDKAWSSETYGTKTDSFIVLGSFIKRALSDIELLFLLAHELGHVKSGHAMYRTVAHIIAGTHSKDITSGGILGFLDIKKLITLPVELPLLAWMRHSEITADRAAILALGDLNIARKVLIIMCLKSADMYKKINIEEYLKQQDSLDSHISKLSEFVSQSSPYIAKRIKLVSEYFNSPVFSLVRSRMEGSAELKAAIENVKNLARERAPSGPAKIKIEKKLRGQCPECGKPYSVNMEKIPKEGKFKLRCSACRKIFIAQEKVSIKRENRQRRREDFLDDG